MAFTINQVVDLSQFGWDGCTITLQSLSYKEAQDLSAKYKGLDPNNDAAQAEVFDFIGTKFVSGTAKDDKGEIVNLKVTDLPDLPIEVFMELVKALSGSSTSPNS